MHTNHMYAFFKSDASSLKKQEALAFHQQLLLYLLYKTQWKVCCPVLFSLLPLIKGTNESALECL